MVRTSPGISQALIRCLHGPPSRDFSSHFQSFILDIVSSAVSKSLVSAFIHSWSTPNSFDSSASKTCVLLNLGMKTFVSDPVFLVLLLMIVTSSSYFIVAIPSSSFCNRLQVSSCSRFSVRYLTHSRSKAFWCFSSFSLYSASAATASSGFIPFRLGSSCLINWGCFGSFFTISPSFCANSS